MLGRVTAVESSFLRGGAFEEEIPIQYQGFLNGRGLKKY